MRRRTVRGAAYMILGLAMIALGVYVWLAQPLGVEDCEPYVDPLTNETLSTCAKVYVTPDGQLHVDLNPRETRNINVAYKLILLGSVFALLGLLVAGSQRRKH